jgi:hypothetical protein
MEKCRKSNKSSPVESPNKSVNKSIKSPNKSPKKSKKQSVENSFTKDEKVKIEKSKTPTGSGVKPRRQKSDRKKSTLKSGRKNDSIISATGIMPITARIDTDDSSNQDAFFQP